MIEERLGELHLLALVGMQQWLLVGFAGRKVKVCLGLRQLVEMGRFPFQIFLDEAYLVEEERERERFKVLGVIIRFCLW